MAYSVLFTEVCTGNQSVVLYEYDWESDFWWSEGNMSCDCNRCLEFLRGQGIEDEKINELEPRCGQGNYSVEIFDCTNGECLYKDGFWKLSQFAKNDRVHF